MFEDALFATNRRRNPQQRWAATLSFSIQVALVTFLVAVPLFFTEALPLDKLSSVIMLPPVPAAPAPKPPAEQVHQQQTDSNLDREGRIVAVVRIPTHIATLNDVAPPPRIGADAGVEGGTGNSEDANAVMHSILSDTARTVAIPTRAVPTKPTRVSHIDEGLLIRKVEPVYPHIAKIAHLQGTVYLHAVIGRDGSIQQLQAVSGPPMLLQAALDAVKQWRYRPYILNGEPVEVETQITVVFRLGN